VTEAGPSAHRVEREADGWVARARKAAAERGRATAGLDVLRGQWPPVLEGDGVRGLLAPMLAAVAWLGAYFRELVAGSALDPLALFMRLLAIGLTTRALLLLAELLRRAMVAARAKRCALVLAPEGLYYTDGSHEAAVEREAIVSVVEPGIWQTRSAGRRWADVYVVGATSDTLVTAIPPVFEHSPGILAERLMRWLGPAPYVEDPEFPDPAPLASKVYDDATRGITAPGTLVVKHGNAWMRRGPYASILLAIAMLEGLPRLAPDVLGSLWPVAAVAALLALVVPLGWVLVTRREISVRKGIAFVLTPAELMLRTRAGVHRARWGKLQRVSIETRRAFSVLDGVHVAKTLVLKRRDESPIRYDEAFLGVPVEVAQVLFDAYRTGSLPRGAGAPETRSAASSSPSGATGSAADQPPELAEPATDREVDDASEHAPDTGQ
jgi:hypothetical protein